MGGEEYKIADGAYDGKIKLYDEYEDGWQKKIIDEMKKEIE